MAKEKIKYKGFLQQLWSDTVWSKVISAGIISLIVFFYSFIKMLLENISFVEIFIDTINLKFELYKIFLLTFCFLLTYAIYSRLKRKRKNRIGKFDLEERVGNFTFRELYNALVTNKIPLPKSLVLPNSDGHADLLTLFILYQRQLNIGVDWDMPGEQGNFAYHLLAPALMTYGLTEKTKNKNKADSLGLDSIQTSSNGFLFYSQLERWRIYNDKSVEDDITITKMHDLKK